MKIPWSESGSAEFYEAAAVTVLQQYRELFYDLRSTATSVCYVATATQESIGRLATGHGSER
eukprot:9688527-Lingulodinium_polyedra.AAC.1